MPSSCRISTTHRKHCMILKYRHYKWLNLIKGDVPFFNLLQEPIIYRVHSFDFSSWSLSHSQREPRLMWKFILWNGAAEAGHPRVRQTWHTGVQCIDWRIESSWVVCKKRWPMTQWRSFLKFLRVRTCSHRQHLRGGLGSQPYSSPAIASTALKIQPRDGLVLTRRYHLLARKKAMGLQWKEKKNRSTCQDEWFPPEKDSANPPWWRKNLSVWCPNQI